MCGQRRVVVVPVHITFFSFRILNQKIVQLAGYGLGGKYVGI